jgi:hypothetical protein
MLPKLISQEKQPLQPPRDKEVVIIVEDVPEIIEVDENSPHEAPGEVPASEVQILDQKNGEKVVVGHEHKEELDFMGHELDLESNLGVQAHKHSADQLKPPVQEEVKKEDEEDIEASSGEEEKRKKDGEPGEGHPEDKKRKRDEKYDEKHSQK